MASPFHGGSSRASARSGERAPRASGIRSCVLRTRNRLIPWDFDDLLTDKPHEGTAIRAEHFRDKLLYSLEERLDVKIASDPYLYSKYLEEFRYFLDKLTPECLSDILEKVYGELFPYYIRPDIISQSEYDKFQLTNLNLLQEDLRNINNLITTRRVLIRQIIENYQKKMTKNQ